MRLSQHQVETLKRLLKEHCGLDYSDEQAQQASLAIMRFFIAKDLRSKSKESPTENVQNEV